MNKDFLEDYSLFRKFTCEVPRQINSIPQLPINMVCRHCGDMQTFKMINDYWEFHGFMNPPGADKKVRLLYQCQSCRQFTRQFDVYISPDLDYVYKFGQYPEWEIKMDKNLENVLGRHAKTFWKGLVLESQAYGFGAFAYYRRITEEIIDELLDYIKDLIEVENKAEYKEALEKTKQTRANQDKIELV